MAGITTLGHSSSIPYLFDQYYFTLSLLGRHPLSRPLVPQFETLRPDLDAAEAEEAQLIWQQYDAEAAVKMADDVLNAIVDGVDGTLLIEVKRDRSSPVYLRYFGVRRPSDLKRTVLGPQLEIMRDWPPSLRASSNPVLQQYGVQLEAAVADADAAAAAKQRAAQQLTDYRVSGRRAQFIDRFNSVRKVTYGQLGEIQHANPSLGSGWAESFFRSTSNERLTLAEVERRIATAEIDLASLQTRRSELLAQEAREAQAREEAEKAERLARLDAARAAMAELQAEIDELEGDLDDGEPEPEPEPEPTGSVRR